MLSFNRDLLKAEFATAMTRLGPFAAKPRLTIGASGGADSTALTLLAQDWVAHRQGSLVALIVDHGLRQGSDTEAKLTQQRLEERCIVTNLITLKMHDGGAKLQEKARLARHAALAAATRENKAIFLLLGHHAADQSETVAMREVRGNSGLQGMAEWTARNDVVILRPLLSIAPARLREFLQFENIAWIEDPSNLDQRFERVRVRLFGSNAVPQSPLTRQQSEASVATFLSQYVVIRPEGFAMILAASAPPGALAALFRTIGGAQYAPKQEAVAKLARKLQPATLGGVRLLKSGRLGPGWLLVREAVACAPSIPAKWGALWDGRFRLLEDEADGICTALGEDTLMFRNASNLPEAVLRGLPCIRRAGDSKAKPRLAKAIFAPPVPLAGLPFMAPEFPPKFT